MKATTIKETKFCEEYVANGHNGTKAYMAAFDSDNAASCQAAASQLLRKPKVINKIKEIQGNYHILGMQIGIDRSMILDRIKEMLNARKRIKLNKEWQDVGLDCTAVNNAIITWAKLTGEFAAEKQYVAFDEVDSLDKDPSKMTHEEREEAKAKILQSL